VTEHFSFEFWLAARARRLRLYRRIANSIFPLTVALILFILGLSGDPSNPSVWGIISLNKSMIGHLLGAAFGLAFLVGWISFLINQWGFQKGFITCPSCDSRFVSNGVLPWWIPRTCHNCGFDMVTLRHAKFR
jgi:hypothetical protein